MLNVCERQIIADSCQLLPFQSHQIHQMLLWTSLKLLKLLPPLPSRAQEPWSPPLQVVPPWPVSSHLKLANLARTRSHSNISELQKPTSKKCEQLWCGLLRDVPILSRDHHIGNAQFTRAVGLLLEVWPKRVGSVLWHFSDRFRCSQHHSHLHSWHQVGAQKTAWHFFLFTSAQNSSKQS